MGQNEDLRWKQDQDLVKDKESDKLTKSKCKFVRIKEIHLNHVPWLYTIIPKENYKIVSQFGRESSIQITQFLDFKNDAWNLYDIGLMCL